MKIFKSLCVNLEGCSVTATLTNIGYGLFLTPPFTFKNPTVLIGSLILGILCLIFASVVEDSLDNL